MSRLLPGLRVPLAQQGQQEPLGRKGRKVSPAWQVLLEPKGQQGQLVQQERPERLDQRALPAASARRDRKAQQALLVLLARPEPPGLRGTRATQAQRDRQAHKVRRASRVRQGQLAHKDRPEQLEPRATPD